MSLDHLPPSIEQDVQRFAAEMHLSHDEAVLRLIQTGLSASYAFAEARQGANVQKPGEELIGLFSSPEDLTIFDEAMIFSEELRQTERLRNVWQ